MKAVLALILLGCSGLAGCGKEGPGEAPARSAKPAEPAPAPAPETKTEPKTEAEPRDVSPSLQEKDRAAGEAPAASPFAPPPPANAPGAQVRRAAPSKADAEGTRGGAPRSNLAEAPPSPQLLRQRLSEVSKQSTPDCPSARDRKQAICDLANQICQLVDRDPDVASVESYCEDAKQRCSDAERRTAQRCK